MRYRVGGIHVLPGHVGVGRHFPDLSLHGLADQRVSAGKSLTAGHEGTVQSLPGPSPVLPHHLVIIRIDLQNPGVGGGDS